MEFEAGSNFWSLSTLCSHSLVQKARGILVLYHFYITVCGQNHPLYLQAVYRNQHLLGFLEYCT